MLKNIFSMTELRIFPNPPIIDERIRFFPSKQELFLRTSFQVLRVLQTLTFYDISRIISPIIFFYQNIVAIIISLWTWMWFHESKAPQAQDFYQYFLQDQKPPNLECFHESKAPHALDFYQYFLQGQKSFKSVFFGRSKVSKFGCSKMNQ